MSTKKRSIAGGETRGQTKKGRRRHEQDGAAGAVSPVKQPQRRGRCLEGSSFVSDFTTLSPRDGEHVDVMATYVHSPVSSLPHPLRPQQNKHAANLQEMRRARNDGAWLCSTFTSASLFTVADKRREQRHLGGPMRSRRHRRSSARPGLSGCHGPFMSRHIVPNCRPEPFRQRNQFKETSK